MKHNTKKLVLSGLFLAIGLVLPFLTDQIPEIGNMISPMHFPVLLCGFICGAPYGALVGLILPPVRFLLFQMPPLYPVGLAMAFEMAAYGLVSGLVYSRVQHNIKGIYLSLIPAMVVGRIVWGIAQVVLMGLSGGSFTFHAFIAGALINAVPAIVLQLILIPLIIAALQKAKILKLNAPCILQIQPSAFPGKRRKQRVFFCEIADFINLSYKL